MAYYSRKLNAAQKNYTVGEKELLSVVETLKEFRTMLYGCPDITVYTDHRNNTFQRLQTQRVLRWRLYLEDYGIKFKYIKGESNQLADALSRLPFAERQNPSGPSNQYTNMLPDNNNDHTALEAADQDPLNTYYSMATDDDDLLDCFINLPATQGIPFVLDYNTIKQAQIGDARLQQLQNDQPGSFADQLLAPDLQVTCYIPAPGEPWKIYLPDELLETAIRWYHLALGHIGQNRLYDSMAIHLYHPDLKNRVEDIVSRCHSCQINKQVGRTHGEAPPREALGTPWREVAVDSIGPWTLEVLGHEMQFKALTIIDTVTNLVEIVRLDNSSAANAALKFQNTWLARYPKPMQCIYDQGTEFTGYRFQQMLAQNGIRRQPISTKNPQANSICERMHQTIGNSLRAMSNMNPPQDVETVNQMIDTAISNCIYATRAALHSALNASPGSLVFARDMVFDIPLIADWQLIQQRRQQLIDQRVLRANRKKFSYDYQVGEEVLKLAYKPNKLQPRATGPFPIETVHANGTVTIRLSPTTIERINIRRIKPYRR